MLDWQALLRQRQDRGVGAVAAQIAFILGGFRAREQRGIDSCGPDGGPDLAYGLAQPGGPCTNFAALRASISEGGEAVIAYGFDLLFLDGLDLCAAARQAAAGPREANRQRLRRNPFERASRR